MEMDYVTEFPHSHVDRRPRKRAKLAWEFPQTHSKAYSGMCYGREVANMTSFGSTRILPDHADLFVKGLAEKGSPPWRDDDKDGHYMFALGDNLTPRYKIVRKIGEGTFGQVLECWDREMRVLVAIKVVRSIKKYREAAMVEVDVLQLLGKYDRIGSRSQETLPALTCEQSPLASDTTSIDKSLELVNGACRTQRCVQIRNWFDYRNHICIVFEMLGPSLYDFLRKNNYRPFPVDLVRELGRQLLECVAFMHDLQLIHTDLKPENILFVSPEYVKVPDYKVTSRTPKEGTFYKRLPKSSAIKVIDFGSTAYEHQDHNYIVSTRHYRAPEVILGLGWSFPCDIWSVGCILVELCSGEALFQTHENLEHLAMMERVLGPMPVHMLKRADRHAEKFVRRSRLNWPEGAVSRESIKAVLKLPRLPNLVMQHVDHSAGDLIDLLQGLLRFDPSCRLTAHEALRHPFFTKDHYRRI